MAIPNIPLIECHKTNGWLLFADFRPEKPWELEWIALDNELELEEAWAIASIAAQGGIAETNPYIGIIDDGETVETEPDEDSDHDVYLIDVIVPPEDIVANAVFHRFNSPEIYDGN